MIYYKVVVANKNRLTSAMLMETNPFFRVYQDEDKKNQIVEHGLVFTSLTAARGFRAFHCPYAQIWECKGQKISLPKRLFNSNTAQVKNVLDYVLYGKKFSGTVPNDKLPLGTIRLKNLQLIRKVES